MLTPRPRGRPARFAHYDHLLASLVVGEKKRPTYLGGIGLFRGERGDTAWIKITLRHGGVWKGKSLPPGAALEVPLGSLASWSWEQLDDERKRLQGLADRREPLEAVPTVTFSAHAKEWLTIKDGQRSKGVSTTNVHKHLEPTFGGKALSEIGVGDVDRWVAKQLKSHKPASVQRQLGTFKAVLNHAVKLGLVDRNPADAAEPIRGIEGRQRFLGPDDLKSVFDAAKRIEQESEERTKYKEHEIKGWLPDFVRWAVHSGMRRQEILDIRLGDIIAGSNGKSLVHIAHTKSGKPRNITCNDEMLAIIKRLTKLRRAKGDDRLFPVSLTTAKRKLNRLWKASGLEDVRLHDLRRTHATELVKGGVNLREVAGRLGHRDLAMLEKHYAVYLGDDEAATTAQTAFASFSGE